MNRFIENAANTKQKRFLIISLVVVVKLILGGLFSSDYQDLMFIPFVNVFLNGNNPYEYYYTNHLIGSFPYFPYMLLIESIGGILLRFFSSAGIFWQNLLFKLPLLFFDIAGFLALRKMNVRFKYATIFYFCSPVVIFGTYIHGQLDIIPTVLLLIAVLFLLDWKSKNNLLLYSIFLGLSIGCKFHIMAAVPILFFYVLNKKDLFVSLKYHLVSAVVVILPCLFFWGNGFIHTVLLNREQSALTTVSLDYGPVLLAIPVVVLTILYLNVYELNYFNRVLLISMLGLLFSVFLICLSPMPAWYIRAVPFYVLYFGFISEDKRKVMMIYAGFSGLYLLYFVFMHRTEYTDVILLGKSLQFLKIDNSTLRSVIFTFMVACLCVLAFKIYQYGIASNNLYRRKGRSFVIGIAGDSGAGKSRMVEKIRHLFVTDKDLLVIEGDGDHKWARGDDNWERYTALNPQANFLYRQAENVRNLKRGNAVLRSEYDHVSGQFSETKKIGTKKYIVVCGLHSLYLPVLRDELDLKIFMDTDRTLQKYWKIQRDGKERGYDKDEVIRRIDQRQPDAEKYIYPQKEYADLIITYYDRTLKDFREDDHKEEISVRIELDIRYDVGLLLKCFEVFDVHPEHIICDDFAHQIIVFDRSEIDKNIDYGRIAEMAIPQYEDFFTYYPSWGTDIEGVIQVMLLFMISEKMKG